VQLSRAVAALLRLRRMGERQALAVDPARAAEPQALELGAVLTIEQEDLAAVP